MFEYDTLPADYGAPVHPSARTMASPTPGQMPGYGDANVSPRLAWMGSGSWAYMIDSTGKITITSEPTGKYTNTTRTPTDGAAYAAIVREAQGILKGDNLSRLNTYVTAGRAKYPAKPTAPSTPTFAPVPGGVPGAAPLAPPPAATPAGAFYEQWWFPPVVALGVLGVVGAGIWYTSGKRK